MKNHIFIEERLLGIILSDLPNTDGIVPMLHENLFTDERAKLFQIIKQVYNNNLPINIATIGKQIIDNKSNIDLAAMISYTDGVYYGHEWKVYANDLNDLYKQREIHKLKQKLVTGELDISGAFNEMTELNNKSLEPSDITAHKLSVNYLVNLSYQMSGQRPTQTYQTFIRPIDYVVTGFRQSEFILLGGRPAMGKTLLALQWALNQCLQNIPIAFITMEMSTDELMQRLCSNLCNIDGHAFLDPYNRITSEQFTHMGITIDQLKDKPLHIVDLPSANIERIESEIVRLKARYGIVGFYLDYFQLISPMPHDLMKGKTEQYTNISKAIKAMCKRHNVFGVVVSSLSRQTEQRPDHRPQLSDLRETGQLEFDANKVVFVYRPSEYMTGQEKIDNINTMEVLIRKNRNGSLGNTKIVCQLEYTKAFAQ
jgi:replicative DNA helicase